MRTLYLLGVIYIALILPGCANNISSPEKCTTDKNPPQTVQHKDPINVSFLNVQKPIRPYQVIGQANVSKYNVVGIKRQEATLRDLMREQAASLNGDAIINIKNEDKTVTATVIAYKQVLV
jgi:hypothetical protein